MISSGRDVGFADVVNGRFEQPSVATQNFDSAANQRKARYESLDRTESNIEPLFECLESRFEIRKDCPHGLKIIAHRPAIRDKKEVSPALS
jgi:hypothetical protein